MIAETYSHWRNRLVRFCTHLLGDPHEAEEIVQEMFARLLAEPERYRLERDAGVLLFRMARNRCIDARRARRHRSNTDIEPPAPEPSDHSDLLHALQQLPAAERETLLLTAVDGLGYREVARILGCSVGTVAARRCAAIQRLRERLGQ